MAVSGKNVREGELRDPRVLLDSLEQDIERLKVKYEQYFRGIEKRPPTRLRERVERRFRSLETGRLLNTATRFRMQTLKARLVTYSHYWNRILKQIEEGTYRQHRIRAQSRVAARGSASGPAPAAAADTELPDGMTARDMERIYRELVEAKRAAGESTDGLTYGRLVKKLAREVPKLREKHGGKEVSFEVSRKGGRVRLRARSGS